MERDRLAAPLPVLPRQPQSRRGLEEEKGGVEPENRGDSWREDLASAALVEPKKNWNSRRMDRWSFPPWELKTKGV